MTSWALYLRAWRDAHRKLGLCRYCNGKRASHATMCGRHLMYHREAQQALRERSR